MWLRQETKIRCYMTPVEQKLIRHPDQDQHLLSCIYYHLILVSCFNHTLYPLSSFCNLFLHAYASFDCFLDHFLWTGSFVIAQVSSFQPLCMIISPIHDLRYLLPLQHLIFLLTGHIFDNIQQMPSVYNLVSLLFMPPLPAFPTISSDLFLLQVYAYVSITSPHDVLYDISCVSHNPGGLWGLMVSICPPPPIPDQAIKGSDLNLDLLDFGILLRWII